MSDIAIRVENLSKQYRIGGQQAAYRTFRESLMDAAQAPFRRLASVVRGQSSAVTDETIWALKDVSFEVQRGLLIAFSGLDGAGKSTQIGLLMERLRRDGREPRYVWTRGGYTPLFERLKGLLRKLGGRTVPPPGDSAQRTQVLGKGWGRRLWLTLALLDLLWVYGVQLRWWRGRGRVVVCDRYLWDTLMDFQINFPRMPVERWWLWRLLVWVAPQPDAAFLLLVPVEESVRRSDVKGEPFRDSPEVLTRRLAMYQALAQENHWHVMDGRRPIPELAAEIDEKLVVERCASAC